MHVLECRQRGCVCVCLRAGRVGLRVRTTWNAVLNHPCCCPCSGVVLLPALPRLWPRLQVSGDDVWVDASMGGLVMVRGGKASKPLRCD